MPFISARTQWPRLRDDHFLETSGDTDEYNCFAHATNDSDSWWSPLFPYYWPDNCPREVTVEAFLCAYGTMGYQQCTDGQLEDGMEKVALYVDDNGRPTHAARQLLTGHWTSKLGIDIDIEHFDLECLTDGLYGKIGIFMGRHREQEAPAAEGSTAD